MHFQAEQSMELPGSFVVMQGIDGDGLINTIDCFPDFDEECGTATASTDAIITDSDGTNNGNRNGGSSYSHQQQQRPSQEPNAALRQVIESWYEEDCVTKATQEATEWLQMAKHAASILAATSHGKKPSTIPILSCVTNRWWLHRAQLRVFSTLPSPGDDEIMMKVREEESPPTLFPGSIVMGVALHTFELQEGNSSRSCSAWTYTGRCTRCGPTRTGDASTSSPTTESLPYEHHPKAGRLQFLEIEASPPVLENSGFVLLSVDGYSVLAPGLPSSSLFTGLQQTGDRSSNHFVPLTTTLVWWWKVTCAAGAVVRQTVDLNSTTLATLPYGSHVQVSKKVINSAGLARLLVRAATPKNNDNNNNTSTQTHFIEGWCSEFLNPLSGERGPILRPIPVAIPTLSTVVLQHLPRTSTPPLPPQQQQYGSSSSSSSSIGPTAGSEGSTTAGAAAAAVASGAGDTVGALVRQRVDLGSPVVRQLPFASQIPVLGRTFTEFPASDCIPRLRLGPRAYASIRLNNGHRNDIFKPTGQVDTRFDPTQPGLYHWNVVHQQWSTTTTPAASCTSTPQSVDSSSPSSLLSPRSTMATPSASTPSSSMAKNVGHRNPICVCCLASESDATLIHDDTGHICCCLECARLCKAQGLGCPLCRKPIERVIQHFYS